MFFWSIPDGSDRMGAFLSWVEGLPVGMVNHLGPAAPTDPGERLALAVLDAQLAGWIDRALARQIDQAHLDKRVIAGGWSPEATAMIRRAALVFLALEPPERNAHAVQLVLAPFDALGPIGSALY